MKKLKGLLLLLLTLIIIVVVIIAIVNRQNRRCEVIETKITYAGEHNTVTDTNVVQMIREAGIQTVGTELKNINIGKIQQVLLENPYIKTVNKVYFTGKKLVIDITLKTLLLHVYPQSGEDYFVDMDGCLLPYSPRIKEKLIIANGFIPQQYTPHACLDSTKKVLNSLYNVAKLIQEDEFYAAQFRQLYMNQSNEIEIIPSVGNHIILFGDEQNAQKKLLNLREVYRDGLSYMEMDKYNCLDARFQKRIIAKKR